VQVVSLPPVDLSKPNPSIGLRLKVVPVMVPYVDFAALSPGEHEAELTMVPKTPVGDAYASTHDDAASTYSWNVAAAVPVVDMLWEEATSAVRTGQLQAAITLLTRCCALGGEGRRPELMRTLALLHRQAGNEGAATHFFFRARPRYGPGSAYAMRSSGCWPGASPANGRT
jgi:hypothetical protein